MTPKELDAVRAIASSLGKMAESQRKLADTMAKININLVQIGQNLKEKEDTDGGASNG